MKTRLSSESIGVIIGHIKGTNPPEQETRFGEWLSVPGNEAEYEKVLRIWNDIAESVEPDAEKVWDELVSRAGGREDAVKGKTVKTASRRFWRAVAGAAAAAVVAAVSVLGYRAFEGAGVRPVNFTSVSGKSRVTLPDGSTVTLNSGSSISYGESFGKKDRKVSAKGRAFFDVAKNGGKPFIVDAEGLEIRVLGTKFDVAPQRGKVVVSLVEGSVTLSAAADGNNGAEAGGKRGKAADGKQGKTGAEGNQDKSDAGEAQGKSAAGRKVMTMSAGEVAVYDRESGEIGISKGDVKGRMLWCSDRLSFSDATLDTVCRDLSQWYGVNVNLAENLQGKGCINFTITDEPLESVLSIISGITRASYRFDDTDTVTIY